MENAQISLQSVDALTITILVDNLTDVFMPDEGPARRHPLTSPTAARHPAVTFEEGEVVEQLRGEHGFSALLTVTRGDRSRRVLFDTGVSPDGLVSNMRMLDLVPGDVEAIVCSHGHFDHTAGLDGFIRAVGRANIPVLIHPEFWTRRRLTLPGREPWELPTTSRSALQGAGFEIVEDRQPSFLLDGSLLVTGEIDRTTDFEIGFPLQEALRATSWQPDPLVLDDQGLVLDVRDRGLVVLTGCGHAGIVNTVRHARRLTGQDRIYAIIGGFHLSGPLFEPQIPAVCAAFTDFAPDLIVATHCTGWRAIHRIASAFPNAFVPSCVGTRLEL
ncbi:MAG: MBL fold metallo-hydrolase [Pseudonocardiales bacterium]|nr:MAG: MBL fold metallo-hydrolase [Pseudonocardiales bacterium]